jgi:hypothetical protein
MHSFVGSRLGLLLSGNGLSLSTSLRGMARAVDSQHRHSSLSRRTGSSNAPLYVSIGHLEEARLILLFKSPCLTFLHNYQRGTMLRSKNIAAFGTDRVKPRRSLTSKKSALYPYIESAY